MAPSWYLQPPSPTVPATTSPTAAVGGVAHPHSAGGAGTCLSQVQHGGHQRCGGCYGSSATGASNSCLRTGGQTEIDLALQLQPIFSFPFAKTTAGVASPIPHSGSSPHGRGYRCGFALPRGFGGVACIPCRVVPTDPHGTSAQRWSHRTFRRGPGA